ncbi:MAG: DNA-directed RNA polymerase subunit beta' [Candidatus Parcubacteria bacterium]|nr:MAG: DNA-directed RNA polymerase subunit beta' [Candidatus Parcubacteria bacterium]
MAADTRTSHNTKERAQQQDFSALLLRLASPETIRSWSYGEVTKPETINYRTQRAEKYGLFDERIFGPERDYECFCGKYKGIRYRGIVCDRCGVEVTRSIVRRERMGHIELVVPVAHIWYLRSIPSRIATVLGISSSDAERVVYFAGYIVMRVNEKERSRVLKAIEQEYKSRSKESPEEEASSLKERYEKARREVMSLQVGAVLDEETYHRYSVKYSTVFDASTGAEALYELARRLDLSALESQLMEERAKTRGAERSKLDRRLALVRSLRASGNRPEWMFLSVLPVIPPALRPMVALEGGRHASSDINDLYRRVINRNNRLKKLMDIHAPEVILRNEKRILQEAVDALLDNAMRLGAGRESVGAARRPLKSLADYLKGKTGYFRQNLLGKRVDYSGRSVIVVGPELHIDECGLPKHMALELFRPFVIAELLRRERAHNIRGAGRLIEDGDPEVWAILEEVIRGKYVLLNRAPTLHRQGIQAFRPVLVEGNAIRLHPQVCPAFNADFDGDQMAVHVPLSEEAQWEAREVITSRKNILKPGNGSPIIEMAKDIALGVYWMTKEVEGEPGEGKYFASPNEAITAYDYGVVGFRAKIKVLPTDSPKYAQFEGKPFETTVGRLLFNSVLPSDFPYLNTEMKKGALAKLVDDLIARYGLERVPEIADRIKNFGFAYATRAGITFGMSDVVVPEEKTAIIEEARRKQMEIEEQYREGLLSRAERKRLLISLWHQAKSAIESRIPQSLDPQGSLHDLVVSGARGSMAQVTQMAGMKGLVASTKGDTIEFPVVASMKEGLSPIEYFITTHGARKGLTDTALNTAKAGYLTRKLFDVAHTLVVREADCGTRKGITIARKSASGIDIPLAKNIQGRTALEDITVGGEVVVRRNELISREAAQRIDAAQEIQEVKVRSPMTCKTLDGVCQHCYGADLTTWELVDLGEAVGTVAAQAIGEPGTQLTMRTFHTGGVAQIGGDITQGLPRVEEVFGRRSPKSPAVLAKVAGVVTAIEEDGGSKVVVVTPELEERTRKGDAVRHIVAPPRVVAVHVGERVEKGAFLSDGSADIEELYHLAGKEVAQEYIITEAVKIYELQGAPVSRKHMETIVKQMFSRRRVLHPGDTRFAAGDVVEDWVLLKENEQVKSSGGEPATSEEVVLGITEVSLTRESWLSAASFQHTTRVLINAALRGAVDHLRGLKENVIVGRIIPAGSGFPGSAKQRAVAELQRQREEAELAVHSAPEEAAELFVQALEETQHDAER